MKIKHEKRGIGLLVSLMLCCSAIAQVNIQLHYDLGRLTNPNSEPNRPNITTTIEMFNPDRLGSTYFFIDLDVYSDGMGGAYLELFREFSFLTKEEGNYSFAAHLEYDGGLSVNKYTNISSRFQQAALGGVAWNWHSNDFAKTLSFRAMYKQYFKSSRNHLEAHASFQFTTVWSWTFSKGLCTFAGFADVWYGYIPSFDAEGRQKKGIVFLIEPQFWFNLIGRNRQNRQFSIGTEWELSDNFIWASTSRTFYFNPTIALKYVF